MALSSDCKKAISGSADGSLVMWDIKIGKKIASQEVIGAEIGALAFTLSGPRVVIFREEVLRVQELTNNTVIEFITDNTISAAAISNDGSIIIAGDKAGRIHLLKVEGLG